MAQLEPKWFGKIAASHALPTEKKFQVPILFVHGAWGGKWQFKNWQEYAAERGWESYAIDLPGHRDSSSADLEKSRMRCYADAVESVTKEIGACYLIGH